MDFHFLEGLVLEELALESFGLLLPTSLTALLAFPGAEQLCQYLCQNIRLHSWLVLVPSSFANIFANIRIFWTALLAFLGAFCLCFVIFSGFCARLQHGSSRAKAGTSCLKPLHLTPEKPSLETLGPQPQLGSIRLKPVLASFDGDGNQKPVTNKEPCACVWVGPASFDGGYNQKATWLG